MRAPTKLHETKLKTLIKKCPFSQELRLLLPAVALFPLSVHWLLDAASSLDSSPRVSILDPSTLLHYLALLKCKLLFTNVSLEISPSS